MSGSKVNEARWEAKVLIAARDMRDKVRRFRDTAKATRGNNGDRFATEEVADEAETGLIRAVVGSAANWRVA